MGVLSSTQVGVRPFRLTTELAIEDIAEILNSARYEPQSSVTNGWGSTDDDASFLGIAPGPEFDVTDAFVLPAVDGLPRRLRVRYYWEFTRERRGASRASERLLTAADVLLYEEADGSFTGLVTARPAHPWDVTRSALRSALSAVDDKLAISVDTIGERLSPDFFLWLVYRLQTEADLGQAYLNNIYELSSRDRRSRGAKFSDQATMERIELAALIALGKVEFGPAKIAVDFDSPKLQVDVELHEDGGFQAFKSSDYRDLEIAKDDLLPILIDDTWVKVLPYLRDQYSNDDQWRTKGKEELRQLALQQVGVLLELPIG